MIRPFQDKDARAVHALYAACHPTWPAKPQTWWWGHPTLVFVVPGPVLVGATAFALSPPPSPGLATMLTQGQEIGWGMGVYVHPDYQGKGHGRWLAEVRHKALKALGCHYFIGLTQPDNKAMIAIFARQGLTRGLTVPRVYPSGEPGVVYSGEIV